MENFESQLTTRWKKFRFFRNDSVEKKLLMVFQTLSQPETLDIIIDYLLNVYNNETEHKLESTLLLSEVLSTRRITREEKQIELIKIVVNVYLEPCNWNLPIHTCENEYEIAHTLSEIRRNILQICLQLEGIGKMALVCEKDFQDMLLKTLYPILERAG